MRARVTEWICAEHREVADVDAALDEIDSLELQEPTVQVFNTPAGKLVLTKVSPTNSTAV
jgi:hypothetical protein